MNNNSSFAAILRGPSGDNIRNQNDTYGDNDKNPNMTSASQRRRRGKGRRGTYKHTYDSSEDDDDDDGESENQMRRKKTKNEPQTHAIEFGNSLGDDDSSAYDSDASTTSDSSDHSFSSASGSREERRRAYNTAPLDPRLDISKDSTSIKTYYEALFRPEVYMKIFYALRITLLVAFPLGVLARHPNVYNNFPAHVVLPLWGVVDCRYTIGEQVATSIVSYQCGLWMGLWGGVNNIWGLLEHKAAWWCSCIAVAFVMSLFGDVRFKRLFVLQGVMILQMENLPGGTALDYPIKVGRDMIIATTFSLLQVLFPPKTIAGECDAMLAKGWKDMYNIVFFATHACWARDPVKRALSLRRMATEPLQGLFTDIPPKLFFVIYEFFESTLRLELRKERVDVMKGCMAQLHAITDTARSVVMSRAARDAATLQQRKIAKSHRNRLTREEEEMQRRCNHGEGDEGSGEKKSGGGAGRRVGFQDEAADAAVSHASFQYQHSQHQYATSPSEFLHPHHEQRLADFENTAEQEKAKAGAKMQERASRDDPLTDAEAAAAAKKLHEDEEVEKEKERQWRRRERKRKKFDAHARGIIQDAVENYLAALDAVTTDLGKYLNPADVREKVRFPELRAAAYELQQRVDKLHFVSLIENHEDDFLDPFFYTNFIFFHVMLIVLAENLLRYGELMAHFDRKRYKSGVARFFEFFFLDYWRSFWEELPKRLTLATPRDVRMLKDAFKMAGAYAAGILFTEYTDPQNVYYFGMAILMGVGWPTAGDTMVASVYRVAGMVFACSIAYMAVWHSPNLSGELAIALAGVFLALLFRDVPVYSHTAQYCSMLIVTALNSAGTKLTLLSRVVSNSFTVMAYYCIVVFVFPINVLLTTYHSQALAVKMVSDRFTALVNLLDADLFPEDPDEKDAILTRLEEISNRRVPMWNAITQYGVWIPKASAHPTTHGLPYPLAAAKNSYSSLRRLGSVTDIICYSLRVLHRDMQAPPAGPSSGSSGESHDTDSKTKKATTGGSDECDRSGSREREPDGEADSACGSKEKNSNHSFFEADKLINDERKRQLINVVESIKPVMRRINHKSRVVMQDFLDAYADPYRWDAEAATRHFSSFLTLASELHDGFLAAHQHNVSLLRDHFKKKVMNRTLNAATEKNLIDRSVFNNESFDAEAFYNAGNNNNNNNNNGSQSASPSSSTSTPSNNNNNNNDNGSRSRSAGSGAAASPNTNNNDDFLKNHSIAASVANFIMQSAPNTPANAFQDYTNNNSYRNTSFANLEKTLRPIEEDAKKAEYKHFTSQKKLEYEIRHPAEYSVSRDMNMVISILVAADIFFVEAERLLKTMYEVNAYSRSRVTPPGDGWANLLSKKD